MLFGEKKLSTEPVMSLNLRTRWEDNSLLSNGMVKREISRCDQLKTEQYGR